MDTNLEDQIITMQVYIEYNKKYTENKQKETDSKLYKIKKWMKNIIDKFDNTSLDKVKPPPKIITLRYTPTGKFHY